MDHSSKSHLKTLEDIERDCIPGLVEVLRMEGIEGIRYALWDMTRRRLYGNLRDGAVRLLRGKRAACSIPRGPGCGDRKSHLEVTVLGIGS